MFIQDPCESPAGLVECIEIDTASHWPVTWAPNGISIEFHSTFFISLNSAELLCPFVHGGRIRNRPHAKLPNCYVSD